MIYNNCPLYSLESKKMLKYLLGITDNRLTKQNYIATLIEPYIDSTRKPRLIEPPKAELKSIQKRIKKLLAKIEVPANIFSGIKGRSYADNALLHTGPHLRNLFKIDITAFFPSISRETVFQFFREDLCCSSDVSCILTDLTTIDLAKSKASDIASIYNFLDNKGVICHNYLISGAPTSQILSYLVNHKMFDEMQKLAYDNHMVMTVYVDDITFSSKYKISYSLKTKVINIIQKYNYQVSKKKVKTYTKLYPKLVTGVIINSYGKPIVKNSIRNKIIIEHDYLRKHPDDKKRHQRLKGLLTAARQVDKHIFPTIYCYAFNNDKNKRTI